ncbi:hypothetical protein D3C80_1341820 [compost metagenome]
MHRHFQIGLHGCQGCLTVIVCRETVNGRNGTDNLIILDRRDCTGGGNYGRPCFASHEFHEIKRSFLVFGLLVHGERSNRAQRCSRFYTLRMRIFHDAPVSCLGFAAFYLFNLSSDEPAAHIHHGNGIVVEYAGIMRAGGL